MDVCNLHISKMKTPPFIIEDVFHQSAVAFGLVVCLPQHNELRLSVSRHVLAAVLLVHHQAVGRTQ